jgi:hypothetical protein
MYIILRISSFLDLLPSFLFTSSIGEQDQLVTNAFDMRRTSRVINALET